MKHYPVDFDKSKILFKYRIIKIESDISQKEIIRRLSELTFEKSAKSLLHSMEFHTKNNILLKGEILPFNMTNYGYKIKPDSHIFDVFMLEKDVILFDEKLFSPLGSKDFKYLIY
uniref:Uncharacterized protein n=1 Tax=Clavaria fumosa TaxID=264083 RepID=A0A7T3PCT7_9AGAR|nr:hypothetical protein KQ422_mgp121 [Clavaria fumosa]QPZ51079.1 hypothetical protein [Clavaria fumosa]